MMRLSLWDRVLRGAITMMGLLVALPAICTAGGPIHGSKSSAMGTAFVAVADDPSAITNNPAGIATLRGTNIYGGGIAIILSSKYISFSGESEDTEPQVFFPPHLYVCSDFGLDNMAFGLGIFSPFGIGGRKWSREGLTRYASTESTIGTIAASPAFALRVFPWLSLGAGVNYTLASNTDERMVNQSALGAGDARLKLEGQGGGWGYNIGILLFPGEKFSFGISYVSESKVDQDVTVTLKDIAPALQPLFGGSEFKTDADGSFTFPQIVTFGVAYRPATPLTFAMDIDWIGWSSFDKMNLDLKREVPQAGLSDTAVRFDFKDTWRFKFGLDYKVNDALSLRGGYYYSENPVPEHTLQPGNPDSDQHNITIGFGYRWGKMVVDAFYLASFYEDRKVNNDILGGKYESFAHMSGLSLGYRF